MNTGFEYRERLGPDAAGLDVVRYLARRYRHSSNEVWRDRVGRGEVSLDDAVADVEDAVRPGQALVWRRPPWEEPAVPLAFAVLYQDEDLLAVAKPSGLPTVPNGGFLTHTLLHLVRARFPEAVPAHRLGRGTSGLVLFTRTPAARRKVAAAWRTNTVEKEYRALVQGIPERAVFSVEAPIGLVPHPRLGEVYAAEPGGKVAVSHVRVLAVRGPHTLVSVTIPTGRPHQIRIHLAFAGHPLFGDPLYAAGGALLAQPGLPGDPGYALHAYRICLSHPVTGRLLDLRCMPPATLRLPSDTTDDPPS